MILKLNGPQRFICQILCEASIGKGNQCVYKNPGHIDQDGCHAQLLFLCPVTVHADSQVSIVALRVTCFSKLSLSLVHIF